MLLPLSQFLRQKKHYEKNIFIFDKDGTITAPNKPLEKKYSECLAWLLEEKQVIILTARDFSICKEHILDILPENWDYSHLIFACSNGSEIYKRIHDSYTCISSLPWNIHEHIEIIEKYIQKINSIENTQLFLEKRSDSMVSVICMPRETSLAERRDFDPDRVKRWKIIKQLLDLLPTLEILPWWSTSIDISLYSKYDWLQHIYKELWISYREALYFGDSFENDGNDITILRDPIEAIEVSSYENLLESFSFDATPKKRVVTIGWGNWHSNMLAWIHKTFEKRISLSSIVSMSDDWRTTWRLMRFFKSDLSLHFPPPWDLRRCLYFLSNSEFSQEFQRYFEEIIPIDKKIAECSLWEIAKNNRCIRFS